MKNLRFAVGILVGFALFWGVTAALAQSGDLSGQLAPTVISISHSVPVEAKIDGVSVPITVDVAMQVRLTGPVSVTTDNVAEPIPTPLIDVATATPMPEKTSEPVVIDDVQWQVLAAYDEGEIWNCEGAMSPGSADTTTGKFGAVKFYVENQGSGPVSITDDYFGIFPDYTVELVDDQGRHFQTFTMGWGCDKKCSSIELNPGLGAECYVVFELPKEVSGLSVQFDGDPSNQSIAIPSLVTR